MDDAEVVGKIASQVDLLASAAVGMRRQLMDGGFPDAPATLMAAHYFDHMIERVFAPQKEEQSEVPGRE